MPTLIELDDELVPESKQMYRNISDYKKLLKGISVLPEVILEEIDPVEEGLNFIRTELRKMIKNSESVIRSCNDIISKYKTKEEYMTSDAKIAKTLHTRLIIRLKRILDYEIALDQDIEVEEEN